MYAFTSNITCHICHEDPKKKLIMDKSKKKFILLGDKETQDMSAGFLQHHFQAHTMAITFCAI